MRLQVVWRNVIFKCCPST